MTTLVTADAKGRLPIRGSQPGRKYLVSQQGSEWRVTTYQPETYPSRNRKQWNGPKSKKTLAQRLKALGDAGLELEVSESAKQPVPPCRF
jgi:hypothetical protein